MSRPHASSVDAQDPWGAGDIASPLHSTRTVEAQPEDDDDELDPAEIQEKERLVKDFTTKQDGLKGVTHRSLRGRGDTIPTRATPIYVYLPRTFAALMERISSVNKETQKIKSGNETLQTYIDNLTRNNAQAAVSGGGKR
ncbi:hypothetical protein MVLG_03372 [Microbotryum lychnidis-dioicae p1A1 Lamole]|uniref:Uncharacterized protein n=1 Tax=Microbotryum lychnidis-dioicae (strain p1A1 Lamole / MvSl-1064) TaxID=683840 RepID=U5H804_USTV1|nr:hypothetical protein MVLG_03372 [Microbotryum lychnidis-dioicae p1A1 Lamole]|eukprot:KDE06334.1 hypothetical protein MVLG_03372 [Microbotryum lychnidis-dioicae p1A1 Lamole]